MYKYSIRLIAFVCMFLCSNILSAEDENLAITAKPHKNNLLIGEPLYINSSIKNSGKSLVKLYYTNGPSYSIGEGWGAILVSEDNEEYKHWGSGTLGVVLKASPLELGPGQEQTSEFTVLYGHYGDYEKDFVFLKEKPYFVRVKYFIRSEEGNSSGVWSTPFRIDVTKPKVEDLSLWDKLQTDTRYAEIVQGPEEITLQQNELKNLSDLCERYPKTTYAPYLALSLGRYYYMESQPWRSHGEGYTRDELENKEKKLRYKALHYLEMVSSITKDQTLREKADIILKRLRPTEEIVREKGEEIVIKGEYLLDAISDIIDHTDVEMNIEEISGLDYVWERRGKYSFKAKVEKGDKEEMLEIAKTFLKEALTQLKLSKKILIKEKDGTLYLVPR